MCMNTQTRNVATASAPSIILPCCFLCHDFCFCQFLEGSGIFPVIASPRGSTPQRRDHHQDDQVSETFPVKFLPPVFLRNCHSGNAPIVKPTDAVTSQVLQWQEDVEIPGGRGNHCHWPPCLSDLNPVEHLWDIRFQSIRCLQVAPQTVQELNNALIQMREGMRQCCLACIEASRGHINWVSFSVATMTFQLTDHSAVLFFPLWFSGYLRIQPLVGW